MSCAAFRDAGAPEYQTAMAERKGNLLCGRRVLAGTPHDAEGAIECTAFSFVHSGSYHVA
jgi:hypothetical protein